MKVNNSGIILLGLGPGDASLLTRSAWQVLLDNSEIYLRTKHHPAVVGLPEHLEIHSFDHFYENIDNYPQVYDRITEEILKLGNRAQGVIYAVPGHPFIAETTSIEIYHRALNAGMNVRVVEGISFIESTMTALALDPFPQLSIVDALELATQHVPGFPPDHPALIGQIHSQQVASDIKLTLMEVYPDEHNVQIIHYAGTDDLIIEHVPLYQIDQNPNIGMLTTLYVPPLDPGTSFESFQEIIAHLRAPDGCPWDREQTHLSLRANLLEETYEALAALDHEDVASMQEEFGDLLLQIVLHAQIASENGDFTMSAIIKGIYDKLINRHPHVFSNLIVENVDQVLKNWERFKADERKPETSAITSLLDGVPHNLPALAQSEQYLSRVARTGFDWADHHNLLEKIKLEMEETINAQSTTDKEKSIGELLFSITALAQQHGIDPEGALRLANENFRDKVIRIENILREQGIKLHDASQEEIKSLWEYIRTNSP